MSTALSTAKRYSRLVIIICLGFILSIFKFGYFGILILLLIEGASNLAEPWISTIVNKNIDSEFRATTLSTMHFISKTPFLILNIIAGRFLDLGYINYFHLIMGLTFLIASQFISHIYKKNIKLPV